MSTQGFKIILQNRNYKYDTRRAKMLLFKFEPKIKRYYIYNNKKTNVDNLIISVLLFGISHFRLIRPKTKEQNGRMETH